MIWKHPFRTAVIGAVAALATAAPTGCPPPPPGPTDHDHVESCAIELDDHTVVDDSNVDMMTFVVGLNHSFPDTTVGVDAAGVEELADIIVSAWPHPEQVVIISSSFFEDCKPTNGACLKAALEKRYGQPLELGEVINNVGEPHRYGTRGVITGSRWHQDRIERVVAPANTEEGVAKVLLRDTVTGLPVTVYAVHTSSGELEVQQLALAEKAQFPAGAMPPIIAGDFNMTEAGNPNPAKFYSENFDWVNRNVMCPGKLFSLQNGNVMQAVLGKTCTNDSAYSYEKATGFLKRVRLSYSVDRQGRLAVRGDHRGADWNGILPNHTAHNVLALGLHLTKQTPSPCFHPPPRCDEIACQEGCESKGWCEGLCVSDACRCRLRPNGDGTCP
ncbi:MAG TPA: hypothetical protein VF516_27165 [Kofleriaceae bacterium]